ncbi:hypothetical protein [Streptomyces sp. NBC_00198]|uniref:hypothetical protein n=1 Tax=Streptomyces sp. NBC_00198 TaxID=2975677 RepID=UPI00225849FA|nr:hypothetical protein [Streptomyces sp. NBC_00198]MCX5285972.1 hypothetical protein [Streptomyces sp. NBC_00198]MCX5286281.1 hypothetical protein [Streptomyces sp. NBC_00198]
MNGPGRCPDCSEAVLWTRTQPGATTAGGKQMPVSRRPDPAGNTAVRRDGTTAWISRRVTDAQPLMGYERLHMPHQATCRAHQHQLPLELPAGVARLDDRRRNRPPGR